MAQAHFPSLAEAARHPRAAAWADGDRAARCFQPSTQQEFWPDM